MISHPESDLGKVINAAYDEAEAKATVDEYHENYHTAAGAEKREAERAEARGDSNFGDLQGIADKYGALSELALLSKTLDLTSLVPTLHRK